jgi:diguanylate cyclase (GGDEF)-like protein
MSDGSDKQEEGTPASILLVDDAPERLQEFRHLLRREGSVQLVASSDEALAVAARQKPDLVLLDGASSSIDGYELCRRLKAEQATQDIPVIFVTERDADANSDSDSDEAKGLGLGAVDYIARPLTSPVLYTRIVNHLGVARANAELKRLATTDPLTGIFNRRHFLDLAGREMARMRRYRTEASCLMLDIDHFKQVNDTYGHDIGDQAITATSRTALQALRLEDLLGRLGGEEFAAMLPMTPLAKAETVAERLRLAIAGLRIATPQGELRFTASIGLAEILPDERSFEEALKRADAALYQAKRNGRNQVVII